MKKRWTMVNECSCYNDSEESVDHILIYCDRTKKLWIFLLVVFGLK